MNADLTPDQLTKIPCDRFRASGTLYRPVFIVIHEALIARLKKENGGKLQGRIQTDRGITEINHSYYSSTGDSDIFTIQDLFERSEWIRQLKHKLHACGEKNLDFNFGEYLYKKRLAFFPAGKKKAVQHAPMRGKIRVHGFFLFFGHFDESTFPDSSEELISWENKDPPVISEPEEKRGIYYTGFYFSVLQCRVKKFSLKLVPNEDGRKYTAFEWGFHKREANDQDVEYQGTGEVKGNILFLNLQDESGMQLNIIAYVMRHITSLENIKIIRCTMQAVSKNGYPLSVEALLVRTSAKAMLEIEQHIPDSLHLEESENEVIKLYLMLQRRNYRISRRLLTDFKDITAKDSILNSHTYIRGIYRIWHFGFNKGEVIQSKFIIDEDFSSVLYPFVEQGPGAEGLSRQNCVLSISKARPNKICVSSHARPGLSVVNYAIIDFDRQRRKGIYEGVFSSLGFDNRGVVSNYMLLKRESEDNFEPKRIPRSELPMEADRYDLQPLLDGLYEFVKSRRFRCKKFS